MSSTSSSLGSQRFTKTMRLRRRREFVATSEIVASGVGRKVGTRHFTALLAPTQAAARVGITVTKKVGDAPTRNRIRRLVREHLRTTGFLGAGWDVVLIAKGSAATLWRLADVARDLASVQRASQQPSAPAAVGGAC